MIWHVDCTDARSMRARRTVLLSFLALTVMTPLAGPVASALRTTKMLPSARQRPVAKGWRGVRQRILGARVEQRGTIDGNRATQTDRYHYVGNGTLERTRSTLKRRVYREGYGGGAERWNLKVTRRDVSPDRAVIKTRMRNEHTVETSTVVQDRDGERRGPTRKKERRLRSYWPTAAQWRAMF